LLFINGFARWFFLLPVLQELTKQTSTHSVQFDAGGLGNFHYSFPHGPYVNTFNARHWTARAVLLAMPYAIRQDRFRQTKWGTYMGIFNFFKLSHRYLPQDFGSFVRTSFGGESNFALVYRRYFDVYRAVLISLWKDVDIQKNSMMHTAACIF